MNDKNLFKTFKVKQYNWDKPQTEQAQAKNVYKLKKNKWPKIPVVKGKQ